ncbi:MAG: hypothetical protein NTV65_03535 [Proteobacteria bacterium]|nr:hypothetical protein [Pseudomonadota bacterium]
MSTQAQTEKRLLPFLQRNCVMILVATVGLILVVGGPIIIFQDILQSESCNSGDPLIDASCRARQQQIRDKKLRKGMKINIRPKQQPFKLTENPLSSTPP